MAYFDLRVDFVNFGLYSNTVITSEKSSSSPRTKKIVLKDTMTMSIYVREFVEEDFSFFTTSPSPGM